LNGIGNFFAGIAYKRPNFSRFSAAEDLSPPLSTGFKMWSSKAEIVEKALQEWKDANLISDELFQRLRVPPESRTAILSKRQWLARILAILSFLVALTCFFVVFQDVIPDILDFLLRFAIKTRCFSSGFLSALCYFMALNPRRRPKSELTRIIVLVFGATLTGFCLLFVSMMVSLSFQTLTLLAAVIYGTVGFVGQSTILWSLGLTVLGLSIDLERPHPLLKSVFLGLSMIGVGSLCSNWVRTFAKPTLVVGHLYFFGSLFFLTLVGTTGYVDRPSRLVFSLALAVVSLLWVHVGLRRDVGVAQLFGIAFFFADLVGKYSEEFWDPDHEKRFFAVLGLFFLAVAFTAENVWVRLVRAWGHPGYRSQPLEHAHED
jgi:hypothetical protein